MPTTLLSPSVAVSAQLIRMRAVASGLLAGMAVLYVIATAWGGEAAVWRYAKAFAEAALVGGLADWFAVSALFRRPLGLPIPHTAVIPRNKERIAQALGAFVAMNFLSPSVVAERLKDQDLAGPLARQLTDPVVAGQLARAVLQSLPSLAAAVDDPALRRFLRRQALVLAADQRVAVVIGQGLEALAEQGRHQALVDAALKEAAEALTAHAPSIRAKVRAKTEWFWRLMSADAKAAEALISALEDLIQDIADDPIHPARDRVTDLVKEFAAGLQQSETLQGEIRAAAGALANDPRLAAALEAAWTGVKAKLANMAQNPSGAAADAIADGLAHLGRALTADAEARAALNCRLKALLAELAGRHGAAAAALIADTIRTWDAATMSSKLEAQVGPDLQYIRINGALIGGVIGLALHQVTVWIAP
ncbi:MAG: DUF445 family protein [Alphaproteobacteria bacterium]|nr:DUF445 family protein [Alphaproteobacteria bacterium]